MTNIKCDKTGETRSRRLRGKKLLVSAGVLVALSISAGVIHAGYKVPGTSWEVSISGSTSGSFGGSLAAARASSDGTQYIGCEVEWVGPTASTTATVQPSNYGYCYARDRNGNVRACYLTIKQGTAAALLANVNQDSYVWVSYFPTSDATYCGAVNVYNYSYGPVKY